MKISYKKLWILLIEKDISPATLRKDLNLARIIQVRFGVPYFDVYDPGCHKLLH